MGNKITKTTIDFLVKCAKEVGKQEAENFDISCWSEFMDLKMTSPIEQIMYVSLQTVCRLNYIGVCNGPTVLKGKEVLLGFYISPQFKIGKYRVDFLVSQYENLIKDKKQVVENVIVECDSQEFHDRSERERRYEKSRDRFFISKGYKVFHFTGTEIIKEPFRVAKEIIAHVTGRKPEDLISSMDDLNVD